MTNILTMRVTNTLILTNTLTMRVTSLEKEAVLARGKSWERRVMRGRSR